MAGRHCARSRSVRAPRGSRRRTRGPAARCRSSRRRPSRRRWAFSCRPAGRRSGRCRCRCRRCSGRTCPSGPSLLNDSDSVQIAPDGTFSPMLMSMAMPSVGCIGPCSAWQRETVCAGLVLEQIDGVAGVVPQQVVGPAARLAQRVHVGAAEEVRLHVHLLHLQFAGLDALVDPLVAGIEAPRVSGHRDERRSPAAPPAPSPRRPGCPPSGSPPARACRPAGTGWSARHASASASPGSLPPRPAGPVPHRGWWSSAECCTCGLLPRWSPGCPRPGMQW